MRSLARGFVDERISLTAQLLQGGREVRHLVGEVMHSVAPALEKLSDRGIGAERSEELDAPGAGTDEDDFDVLGFHDLSTRRRGREEGFPERNRFIEGRYGDPHVIENPFVHW